ncbi:subclass B1 metallo-beta-lactamase [Fulvivirga ligni]|uniref:subclass B1 metallo-beta-lactamase n=1 Tax=Fulvivirga ligni TaxID=2904246 RepID=UPI001F459AA4|nr:subclass B1 metallo-beta-lactamase [Fulvivirga ligni]UII19181.1 subclass B1 metallo-beta-lactamase [Fulvivirga ligni]
MSKNLTFLIGFSMAFFCCKSNEDEPVYSSENLIIHQLSDHVYEHITYLNTDDFGKVECNGMIVIDGNEALVFDTPSDSITSEELVHWIQHNEKAKINAVIPTHFHIDCLGGLDVFHKYGIPSYANELTITNSQIEHYGRPQFGFDGDKDFTAGSQTVEVKFMGEGHTSDNVIVYVPDDQVMFGGCLLKCDGAGKGNLGDANINAWPQTMQNIEAAYPDVKTVIPGHGKVGGKELFTYTEKLFTKE